MSEIKIVIYGTEWCGDCRRTKRFFQEHNIGYQWINIDKDKIGEQFVLRVNQGMRSVPTVVFPDGTILVEPSNRELAEKFVVS
jgi:mycoredoxin